MNTLANKLVHAAKLLWATTFKPEFQLLGKGDDAYDLMCRDYVEEHPEALKPILTALHCLPASWLEIPLYREINKHMGRVTHKSPSYRASVALHQHLPAILYEMLADDKDRSVRAAIAENHYVPSDILDKLIADESTTIRCRLARNNSSTAHALEQLANEEDPLIRQQVARNTSTPPHVLTELASDPNRLVKINVMFNESTPQHIRDALQEANP